MSATEELRAMLDERGESYVENDFGITWRYYSDPHTATDSMDGTLQVTGLTPEQAIAATLGAGACCLKEVDKECDSASEYMVDRYWCFDAVYKCSCGHLFGYVAQSRPHFCPNCGAQVVDA